MDCDAAALERRRMVVSAIGADGTQRLFGLDGRAAIVAGASGGLGERFAKHLEAVGAGVIAAARRADRLDPLVASSERAYGCPATSPTPATAVDDESGPFVSSGTWVRPVSADVCMEAERELSHRAMLRLRITLRSSPCRVRSGPRLCSALSRLDEQLSVRPRIPTSEFQRFDREATCASPANHRECALEKARITSLT